MKSIEIISSDLLGVFSNLEYPVVITKNKEDEARHNFREDVTFPGRWLDGLWRGKPKKILPGCGFVIHFVERESLVWFGEYKGTKDEGRGRYSLVIDNIQKFLILDLYDLGVDSKRILQILKQPGAVTYSYYQSEFPHTSNDIKKQLYKMAQVKVRLQQSAFRRAVFTMYGARCMITGCDTEALLDAAHLPGRYWEKGHNSGSDGIPLRVDLHRALDAGLIGLDHQYRINYLHPDLQKTYGDYLDIEAVCSIRSLPDGLACTMLEHAGHKVKLDEDFDEDVEI